MSQIIKFKQWTQFPMSLSIILRVRALVRKDRIPSNISFRNRHSDIFGGDLLLDYNNNEESRSTTGVYHKISGVYNMDGLTLIEPPILSLEPPISDDNKDATPTDR